MAFEREELINLAIMGVGAGAKGVVTGYLKNVLPNVTEDILAVVAGGALYYFGGRIHPYVRVFGAGVLIAGIGQLVSGVIPQLGGGAARVPAPSAEGTTDLKAIAQMQANMQVPAYA